MLVVAFDADAEHVFNGLTQTVEGGARQGLAFVQVVSDPQLTDLFEGDAFGPLYGAHQPCVLFESVRVSHNPLYFGDKSRK